MKGVEFYRYQAFAMGQNPTEHEMQMHSLKKWLDWYRLTGYHIRSLWWWKDSLHVIIECRLNDRGEVVGL